MPDHAEAHSHTIQTNRNCTMEITNVTANHFLVYPRVHLESGFPFSPPQPTLAPSEVEVCSFTKKENAASGAVGVMTYELYNMLSKAVAGQLAVMFSVPFDYNFYKNWLAVSIFAEPRACDKALFEHMYKEKDGQKMNFTRYQANGGGVTFRTDKLEIRATMNEEGSGIVKVELYDRM